jgi:hypothetical protein
MSFAEHAGDWPTYFRLFHEEVQIPLTTPEDEEEIEAAYEALARARPVNPRYLPTKAKQVFQWAERAGCDIEVMAAPIRRPAQFYKSDSAKKDAEGSPINSEGDLRSPERFFTAWHLRAVRRHQGQILFAFIAQWNDGSFDRFRILDRVGQPEELYVDYFKHGPKRNTPEWAMFEERAARLDEDYNDGDTHIVHDYWIDQDAKFKVWIEQWSKILKIEPLPVPKPRVTKAVSAEERTATELSGGDWHGG